MTTTIFLAAALATGQPPTSFDIRPGFTVQTPAAPTRPADWPAGVPWTEGMRQYAKARHSQRIVILNGADDNRWQHVDADDHFANAPTVVNPNRQFPWRHPGGLDRCEGASNKTYVYHPPGTAPTLETRYVAIEKAERPLPRHLWWHPDGTVLADQLFNAAGECFEVRMRKKIDGRWANFRYGPRLESYRSERWQSAVGNDVLNRHGVYATEYRVRRVDGDLRGAEWDRLPLEITYTDGGRLVPRDYLGPGLHCNTCHQHSGSTSYGIAVRGGGDGDFSYSPYEDR